MMARRSCFVAVVVLSIGDFAKGFHFSLRAPSPPVKAHGGPRLPLPNKRWAAPPELAPQSSRASGLVAPLQAAPHDTASRQAPILVTGNNVEVTEPLKEYVEKKMARVLEKVGTGVSKVDVHMTVSKNPRVSDKHKTEVTIFSKNHVFKSTDASDSMYASVDLVTDRIRRKLRKSKERKITGKRHAAADLAEKVKTGGEEIGLEVASVQDTADTAEEVQDDPFEDSYGEPEVAVDMSVVKRKSFPMPPITVEEAVICLEYIDHNFYLFRNVDTNEVNVVYMRNHGGVGLIQPEADT